ncbi:hypothetical protein ES708_27105 [subsurface metagenome]
MTSAFKVPKAVSVFLLCLLVTASSMNDPAEVISDKTFTVSTFLTKVASKSASRSVSVFCVCFLVTASSMSAPAEVTSARSATLLADKSKFFSSVQASAVIHLYNLSVSVAKYISPTAGVADLLVSNPLLILLTEAFPTVPDISPP